MTIFTPSDTRVQGWARLLNIHIVEWQDKYLADGFVWGQTDCAHFVGSWYEKCTGQAVLDQLSSYTTKEDAFAYVETLGGLRAALATFLGEEISAVHAHRGDIAYHEPTKSCGIFFTNGTRMLAVFLGEGGMSVLRAEEVTCAFKVGRE